MKTIFSRTTLLLLVLACSYGGLAQERPGNSGWKEIKACAVTLLVPRNLENAKLRNLDSCVAGFRSDEISVYIDSGIYNAPTQKDETMRDFSEEILTVDGKQAQVVTYLEDSESSKANPNRKYVTVVYVRTSDQKPGDSARPFSFWMKISGKSSKEQQTAKQIVNTIRF